eukprot:TRINITY_DN2079_c1_g3_i3.p1 TRINITY_DN2079_c1_g3~~TRINITY_DN2079_c1_g3_i3.p1  ORF type:complete len:537 (+),score=98.52 TRINITY_DN2079_c1_g3_i3:110-1720(+)
MTFSLPTAISLSLLVVLVLSLSTTVLASDACSGQTSCGDCSNMTTCFWCESESTCQDFSTNATLGNCKEWCQGDACVCEYNGFFPVAGSYSGDVILMAFYAIILGYGAKLISDGSELLLEILDPGIIGGLVLPILGAVPDAAIIVVAGAFGTAAQAQRQVAVGVGTLAGSTIMLLTLPWSAGLWLARCDFDPRTGLAQDNTLTSNSLTKTGVTVDNDTPVNAKIMVVTSVLYLVVQGRAFFFLSDDASSSAVAAEKWFALVGCILCASMLVVYCVYQIVNPKLQQAKIDQARNEYLMKQAVHALVHRTNSLLTQSTGGSLHEADPLIVPAPVVDVRAAGLKWKRKAKEDKEQESAPTMQTIQQEDEEEDEGVHQSTMTIALQASALLGIGVAMVAFFSDPMVSVITAFGDKTGIPSFYISFVVTPFCSNASEAISSLIFASKKKKTITSLTFSQLYGAATMNNTLCLGIFYALIYYQGLAWTFTAETITILVVILLVGLVGSTRTTMSCLWIFPVASLYPLSIALIWFMENVLKLD